MKVYKEVPHWWFLAIFGVTFVLGLGLLYAAKSGLPWWAYIVSLIITAGACLLCHILYI
jgi:hypothetical protein